MGLFQQPVRRGDTVTPLSRPFLIPPTLRDLDRDARLLFAARMARMFGYGFLAGGLKIVYDLGLLAGFRRVKPPEEAGPA